jgi:4-carboxymuconolactone decarboxylase
MTPTVAPRLSPLPVEQWGEDARAVFPRYLRRPELYLTDGPDARPMPGVLGLFAHHFPLGEGWLAFNDVLANQTRLDVRLRELVILRVAWRTRSAYEWAQHLRIGHQSGLTPEQLHSIPAGVDAAVWSPVESAALRATDEMIDRHRVSDEAWQLLSAHFDPAELLELLFVVGAYLCFALVANSAALQADPSPESFDAPALPESGD